MNDLEKTNLEVHVTLCEQRYANLESRIDKIEAKIDEMTKIINNLRLDFFKIMVGTAGSIIVAIVGGVSLVLSKIS
jgi:uncharacterized protein (UPF0212 family)